MELFIFAQTLFYLTASVAIMVFGALCMIVIYQAISIMKHLEHISDNLDDTADEVRERIREILDRLEDLPILSYFFKKRTRNSRESHHHRT